MSTKQSEKKKKDGEKAPLFVLQGVLQSSCLDGTGPPVPPPPHAAHPVSKQQTSCRIYFLGHVQNCPRKNMVSWYL